MMNLRDVHTTYKKWLSLEDMRRIDVMLAVALSRKLKGTKLWLIIVGPSGDGKSEQINALNDGGLNTKVIRNFTSKTLVNGNPKIPDLAPTLQDKILIISDFAPILKLHPNEKGEVWAQLRDLYDGFAGKQSGLGKDAEYKDLNVTLVAGSTPVIDSQILIHQDLGTRELVWRTAHEDEYANDKLMEMCWKNEEFEEQMRFELKEVTNKFINECTIKPIKIPDEIKERLKIYCEYLRIMRSPAELDQGGELRNIVYPEKPSRILKQLKRVFICLKSLDEEYTNDMCLSVIEHLIKSSSFPNRVNVLNKAIELHIEGKKEITQYLISEKLRIGRKTAYREMNVLWNLKLLNKRVKREENFGRIMEIDLYSLNDENELVKTLMPTPKDNEEVVK
jgi:hypothetical protein